MVWPLRYSTMVEHGKCASGSSSDLCGAYAVGLDAIVSSKDVEHPGVYRAAQVSLIVLISRTLNVEPELPELAVPRTVTLCPMYLAKPSVGKPSAARVAMSANVWSFTSPHLPSCSSTHPVNESVCPL